MANDKSLSRRSFITKSLVTTTGLICAGSLASSANNKNTTVATTAEDGLPQTNSLYSESPMLKEKVLSGKLPPVHERLPIRPFVRQVDEPGVYGGTFYNDSENQGGRFFLDGSLIMTPQETDNLGVSIVPHVCEKVEHNDDYTEFIFHIREGLRWSDGPECTADDIIWWWEHEQKNKELYPEGPRVVWKVGNKYAEFEKLSKWVFKISFALPFRPLTNISCHDVMSFGNFFGQPAHYMKQFHIDFNPKANELAKSYGYEAWFQLYKEREEYMRPHANKPNLGPWYRKSTSTTHDIFIRNPYFSEVDQYGNQLPYIDKIFMSVVEDRKLRDSRIATGAASIGQTVLSQIFINTKNQKKADYKLKKWTMSNSSECMFAFNLNHKDPVLKEIYNDLRFRKAMSIAINRKKINDFLYFGLATECQATIDSNVSFFDPEWQKYYAGYNIEEANRLLDEMGLEWDSRKQYRIRPDGKRLTTVVLYNQQTFPLQLIELVRQEWSSLGMETILRESDDQFRHQRCAAGDHDCTCWNADLVEEIAIYLPWTTKWNPNDALYYAVDWWYWFYTEGVSGIEPPQIWKDQFNRMVKWYNAKNDEEYAKLGYEVWDFFTKQLVCIGTVGYSPLPIVVKNGLKNVKDVMKMGYGTVWAKSYLVQTYFWDNPQKHL